MPSKVDVLVIGAGHNGLVCAAYVARAGYRVLLLERRPNVGGACVNTELFPGCYTSHAACWYGMLRPEIVRDLALDRYGLDVYVMNPQVTSLHLDRRPIRLWLSGVRTELELFNHAKTIASGWKTIKAYQLFTRLANEAVELLESTFLGSPPTRTNLVAAWKRTVWGKRYPDLFDWSVATLLHNLGFESDLAAALGFSSTAITNTSPFASQTAFSLFYMLAAQTSGRSMAWGFARGGMGRVTEALSRSAEACGAVIRTEAEVTEILIADGAARGVVLQDGEEITGRVVVSSLDPLRTFLALLPADSCPEFQREVSRVEAVGYSSVIHYLLSDLPRFFAGWRSRRALHPEFRGLLVVAPSLEYIDEAWRDATHGQISREPVLTISIQSYTDSSITRPGSHLMSVYVQFTPYQLSDSMWEHAQHSLISRVTQCLEKYAPGFASYILDTRVLTPADLERDFSLTNGHPEHINMTWTQMFDGRFSPDSASEAGIKRLYLCGAATHPGGTVTGAPGYNAAQQVISHLNNQRVERGQRGQIHG